MAAHEKTALLDGARNLLVNCAGITAGGRLAVICEDPSLGWYDAEAPEAVRAAAAAMDVEVTMVPTGGPTADAELPPAAADAMQTHDQTVFFARLGDQSRFSAQAVPRAPVMSYARIGEMLGSDYGRHDYRAFLDLKSAVNSIFDSADQIRITCPLGTDITGGCKTDPAEQEDVTVKRFPMGIHKPVAVDGFSGRAALSRCLVSTGSRSYSPAFASFDSVVHAGISGRRITGFTGSAADTAAVSRHYETVAGIFGIEPMFAHSWHAGLHPGCAFSGDLDENPDLWGNTVFQNPRVLHFHTCGARPPGEISWNIIDPDVEVDGVLLWRNGVLNTASGGPLDAVMSKWPDMRTLHAGPPGVIGV